jgi:hypothetical protein
MSVLRSLAYCYHLVNVISLSWSQSDHSSTELPICFCFFQTSLLIVDGAHSDYDLKPDRFMNTDRLQNKSDPEKDFNKNENKNYQSNGKSTT